MNHLDNLWDYYDSLSRAINVSIAAQKIHPSHSHWPPLPNFTVLHSNNMLDDWITLSMLGKFEEILYSDITKRYKTILISQIADVEIWNFSDDILWKGKGMPLEKVVQFYFKNTKNGTKAAISNDTFNKVDKLRNYRNWLAHGKRWKCPIPGGIHPQDVRAQLESFFNEASL